LLFVLITFLLLILVLFLPIKVIVDNEISLYLKIKLGTLTIYKHSLKRNKNIKEKSTEEKVDDTDKKATSLTNKIKYYLETSRPVAVLVKKYIEIESIFLNAEIGTSEASSTAICVGVMWSAIYRILGVLGSFMYISDHRVNITPFFNERKFSLKGKCIFKSRLVYIIIIATTILIKFKPLRARRSKQ